MTARFDDPKQAREIPPAKLGQVFGPYLNRRIWPLFTPPLTPFLGIWRKPIREARFICIEPWWGTVDPLASYDDFRAKPHLQFIGPGERLEAGFTLTFDSRQ